MYTHANEAWYESAVIVANMHMYVRRLPGRELQKWTPEASDDMGSMLLESEPHGKSSAKWDQFAANQQLFGTDTSYNEDLYTTKLDASVSGITVEEAERLAAEIQRGNTSSRHVAEERGGHVDDSGVSRARSCA